MGAAEKIKEIEDEMAKTQKNKATEYHMGRLKAKLAKLRREILEGVSGGGKGAGEGFAVEKQGNARVSLVGFPSVGKSSLLGKLTETESEVSSFEFTTLTCIPGVIKYNNAKIQLLDLPGIIEGAAQGKGNGRQVLAVAKASDLLLIVLEPLKATEQRRKILKELFDMGIRINCEPPKIRIRRTEFGGVKLNSTCKLSHIDEKGVQIVFSEYKIFNAEVIMQGDYTIDEVIDALEGNRKYVEALYVYNKIDTISIEDVDELARRQNSLVISVKDSLNLDYLLEVIWERLSLVRVYTKKRGAYPDFEDPIILTKGRRGCTIKAICENVHKDFVDEFKYALVWGRSCKFSPQTCGLNHDLMDEDVIQLFATSKSKMGKTAKKTEKKIKLDKLKKGKKGKK